MSLKLVAILLVLIVLATCSLVLYLNLDANTTEYNPTDSNPIDLIHSKGFLTEKYKFTTPDGYELSLTRVLNPLFNNGKEGLSTRRPMLFVPGELASPMMFALFSFGVKTKDLSNLEADELAKDPSSNSILFLGLNRGHEAWLLHRRGNPGSLGHTKYHAYEGNDTIGYLKTGNNEKCDTGRADVREKLASVLEEYSIESIDVPYWNYSLDEQASFDIPKAIDKVLEIAKQEKLSLIGHSSGSSLIMMALVAKPELSNQVFSERLISSNALVSTSILLSPTIYRSDEGELEERAIYPVLTNYTGPISNEKCTRQLGCLMRETCRVFFKQRCDKRIDLRPKDLLGNNEEAEGQVPLHHGYGRSAAQFRQIIRNKGKRMHFHDFGSINGNIIKYGRRDPPVYDLGRIDLATMGFWYGKDDFKIDYEDVTQLVKDLKATTLLPLIPKEDEWMTNFLRACIELAPDGDPSI